MLLLLLTTREFVALGGREVLPEPSWPNSLARLLWDVSSTETVRLREGTEDAPTPGIDVELLPCSSDWSRLWGPLTVMLGPGLTSLEKKLGAIVGQDGDS